MERHQDEVFGALWSQRCVHTDEQNRIEAGGGGVAVTPARSLHQRRPALARPGSSRTPFSGRQAELCRCDADDVGSCGSGGGSTATGRQSRSRDASSLAAPCNNRCMSWAGLGLSGLLFVRGRLDVGVRTSGLAESDTHSPDMGGESKKVDMNEVSQSVSLCLLFTGLRPDAPQAGVARPEFRLCSTAASQRKRRRS